MAQARPRLALTLGDPRGIGPEVTAAAMRAVDGVDVVVVGPEGTGVRPDEPVGSWSGGDAAEAGALAGAAIERAAALALEGTVDGIVTAPIDKAALAAGGYAFPGHTEMLQALAEAPVVAMLMAAERTALGDALRVVLATTHLPLRDVPDAVTTELLVRQARITDQGLRAGWGM
ncbi:MAG TPA: 4-hydroxythreonine-4-phosphate dehydrogenase PdxA, partial [Longimicrobiales bacterium]|nr:4-hydroxythreonine-4-phosphate dehydrogenase PdxA [Longimicrobiales bacterium]